MDTKGIDLTKCNNCRFKAVVDGKEKTGRIQIASNCVKFWFDYHDGLNDQIYYCIHILTYRDCGIDDFFDSFEIVPRDPETYKDWQVGDKVCEKDNKDSIYRVIFRSGDMVVTASDSDRALVYTCNELYNDGCRLVLTDIEQQIIEEKKVVEDIPKPSEFKKGEPVLVRNDNSKAWVIRSFLTSNPDLPIYEAMDGILMEYWKQCVPYNEKTMHLLGTTEDYKEE